MATKWSGDLLSGNPIIDFQHRLALETIKKLMMRLRSGDGLETFKEALIFFECYCIEHFGDEEKILEEHKYPDLENHRAEHKIMTNEIEKMKIRYENEGYSQKLGLESMAIISSWLKKHFDKSDREMIIFLKQKYPIKKEIKEQITA
jgi:hemerythrin